MTMVNLTGLPIVLAEDDRVILKGALGLGAAETECSQARPFNEANKVSIWTHHDCEDHDVVIVWPNVIYAAICNCGPLAHGHAMTEKCPPERKLR